MSALAIGVILALAASGISEINAAVFKADQAPRSHYAILGLLNVPIFIGLVYVSGIRPGTIGAVVGVLAYFVIQRVTSLGYVRMLERQFESGREQGQQEVAKDLSASQ